MPRRGKRGKDALSFGQLREWYDSLQKSHDELRRSYKLLSATSSGSRRDVIETREDLKEAKAKILTLTAKENSRDEAKKAAAWSASSAVVVTILLETWEVIGHPGGGEWAEFWRHSAVQSSMIFLFGLGLSLLYKLIHDDM